MDTISFAQFGRSTHFDAAHIVGGDGYIWARVVEPQLRLDKGLYWAREGDFRAAVRSRCRRLYGRESGLVIQWDPDRDQASEEGV